MKEIKFCKDCKFYVKSDMGINYDRCSQRKIFNDDSMVRGEEGQSYNSFCDTNRIWNWLESRLLGMCGKEGRFFEDKNKKSVVELTNEIDKFLEEINKK